MQIKRITNTVQHIARKRYSCEHFVGHTKTFRVRVFQVHRNIQRHF